MKIIINDLHRTINCARYFITKQLLTGKVSPQKEAFAVCGLQFVKTFLISSDVYPDQSNSFFYYTPVFYSLWAEKNTFIF